MKPQGLHKRGYIKILMGLQKMGLHKVFETFGGLHKKLGLGVTLKKTYAHGSLKSDLKVTQKWSKIRLEVA